PPIDASLVVPSPWLPSPSAPAVGAAVVRAEVGLFVWRSRVWYLVHQAGRSDPVLDDDLDGAAAPAGTSPAPAVTSHNTRAANNPVAMARRVIWTPPRRSHNPWRTHQSYSARWRLHSQGCAYE